MKYQLFTSYVISKLQCGRHAETLVGSGQGDCHYLIVFNSYIDVVLYDTGRKYFPITLNNIY